VNDSLESGAVRQCKVLYRGHVLRIASHKIENGILNGLGRDGPKGASGSGLLFELTQRSHYVALLINEIGERAYSLGRKLLEASPNRRWSCPFVESLERRAVVRLNGFMHIDNMEGFQNGRNNGARKDEAASVPNELSPVKLHLCLVQRCCESIRWYANRWLRRSSDASKEVFKLICLLHLTLVLRAPPSP
jgi:hypothetical protein